MRASSIIRYLSVVIVVLALAAPLRVFAESNDEDAASGNVIEIKEYKFTPDKLTVHEGASVTWINRDQVPHTVVEANKAFRSAALDTNDKFTYTFETPGTYTYFCSLHPQMTGTVTVQP